VLVVDEYHLVTHPVIARGGKKPFGNVVEMRCVLERNSNDSLTEQTCLRAA
jgi:hypothetical protein